MGQSPPAAPPPVAGPVQAPPTPPPAGPAQEGTEPPPAAAPPPAETFDVVPDAEAAARARQEAENARRYAAERARREAEEAEREAFRRRQAAAAALFEQPLAAPPPTPVPGQGPPPSDSGRWAPAPTPTPLPQAAPPTPVSQLPGAAEAKRFAPRPVVQHGPPKAGDLVCGNCGTGNDPARKFCRQCGASLVAAVVEPKLPWWKRLFQRSKKKVPPPRPTGPGHPSKRTQRRRNARKVLGWFRMGLMVIAIGGALGIAALPALRTKVTDFASCKSRQARAIVKPPLKSIPLQVTATATPDSPEHPAIKAFDTNIATYWQVPLGTRDNGAGSSLTVEFDRPSTVRQIHFFPGLPKDQRPDSQPTPQNVKFAFISLDGDGKEVPKEESFTLAGNVVEEDQLLKLDKARKKIVKVKITIVDLLPNVGAGTQVAVTDVQFFGSPAPPPGEKCKVG